MRRLILAVVGIAAAAIIVANPNYNRPLSLLALGVGLVALATSRRTE